MDEEGAVDSLTLLLEEFFAKSNEIIKVLGAPHFRIDMDTPIFYLDASFYPQHKPITQAITKDLDITFGEDFFRLQNLMDCSLVEFFRKFRKHTV